MKVKTKVFILILTAFIAVFLYFINLGENNVNIINFNKVNNKEISYKKKENNYAILPHFMLGKDKVDQFYNFLKSKYKLIGNKLNIVIISPNHFEEGKHQFISYFAGNACFKNNCIYLNSLIDNKIVFNGDGKIKYSTNDDLEYKMGNNYYTFEHGVGAHFEFMKKYFSGSNIYGLVINPHSFLNLDKLIKFLNDKFSENTLFLASVDFSHYNLENFAYLHDRHTLYTLLNSYSKKDYRKIEVDCPACLYVLNNLAKNNKKYPHLWYRDSSSIITKKEQNFSNTSRNFYFFDKKKEDINGITIAFFGDVIYDRGIKYYFSDKEKFYKFLGEFFMEGNYKGRLLGYNHRKLFGQDFAGFNLETPVSNKKDCQITKKKIHFCSDSKFLSWLKNIGFNIVSFANNHAMDGGKKAFLNTIKNLKLNNYGYFGFIRHGKYYEHNFVYTGKIRSIKYAWHGYDFTISHVKFEKICKDLKNYKNKGYLNFVVVHWGDEYRKKHNLKQEILAHNLIDCGANLIIGAHPHVIEDIGYYKKVPIIYSLGNFIFDQFKIKGGNIGGYVVIDVDKNGKINFLKLGDFNIDLTGIKFNK